MSAEFQRKSHAWFQTMQSIMAGSPHMKVQVDGFDIAIIKPGSLSVFDHVVGEMHEMEKRIYLNKRKDT
jgi:hypothetical protein